MYRRLINYLPAILQSVREFKAIMESEQPELNALWDALDTALTDQYLLEAGEYGISRWEEILKIIPVPGGTLDERRFRIYTMLNNRLPYTITSLRQQLAMLCGKDGYEVELKNNEYTLNVKVALTAKNNFNAVGELLHKTVPANLIIDLTLKYNQHSLLHRYTHSELSNYTHDQLKNEVIT